MDFPHFSNGAVLDELDGGAIFGAAVDLHAHLGDAFFFGGEGGHGADFRDVVSEGFLSIKMEATIHRHHADGGVHMVRGGDIDAIEVGFFFEEFAEVGVDTGLGKFFAKGVGAFFADIATGNDFEERMTGKGVNIGGGHSRAPESGVTDFAIWGEGTGAAGDPWGDDGTEGEFLEERATGARAVEHRVMVLVGPWGVNPCLDRNMVIGEEGVTLLRIGLR